MQGHLNSAGKAWAAASHLKRHPGPPSQCRCQDTHMKANRKWPHAHAWLPTLIIMELDTTRTGVTVCVISAWTFFKETYISHPHEVSPRTTPWILPVYLPICPFTLYLQTNLSTWQSPYLRSYLQYLFIHLVTCLVVVPFTYLSTYWPLCLSLAAHLMSDGQASLSNPHTYSSVSQLSYQCHQGHFSTSHPTSFTSESFRVHYIDCAAVLAR